MKGSYFQSKTLPYANEEDFQQAEGTGYLGYDTTPVQTSADLSQSAAPAAGGAGLAASGGNPYVAGAMIAGSFLSNYLAQKAADERQKKELAMRTQENYANDQSKALDTQLAAWRGALR